MHKANHNNPVTNLNIAIDHEKTQLRVVVGYESLSKLTGLSQSLASKFLVLTENNVADLWFGYVNQILKYNQDNTVKILSFPASFSIKDSKSLLDVYGFLHQNEFSKDDTIIALGGGDICDLAGFAAATYLRGINLINIPTTLLSQIDAGIGGKNGYNLMGFKNVIGTIYHPKFIFVDFKFLESLPSREFYSGMAEIIKYSFIEKTISEFTDYRLGPRPFFEILNELSMDNFGINHMSFKNVVLTCLSMKLNVVAKDPLDKDIRRCLNFGHTFGHAIEATYPKVYNHGEAISIGMIYAFKLASMLNLSTLTNLNKAKILLTNFNLPIGVQNLNKNFNDQLIKAFKFDKKRIAENIDFILPLLSIGCVDYKYCVPINTVSELFLSVNF